MNKNQKVGNTFLTKSLVFLVWFIELNLIDIQKQLKFYFFVYNLSSSKNLKQILHKKQQGLSIKQNNFIFLSLIDKRDTMSRHKNYSFNDFHLPQIKRYSQTQSKKSSIYSQNHSILSRYEQQLKTPNKKYQSQLKQKKRQYRLKTIDVNQHESYDDLRRELRSIKEQVSYNMKEYNHKIENKFQEFVLMSALKKNSQPQVVVQPMPMYYPPIYPTQSIYPQMRPQIPPLMQDYHEQYPNYSFPNLLPPRPKPIPKPKIYSKMRLKKFKKYIFAVLFTVRLKKFTAKVIRHRKQMFNKYLYNTNQFKQQAGRIKKLFIECMRPLLVTLLQRQDSEIKLNEGDSDNFKKQKLASTHKLIQLLIQCMRKTIQTNEFNALIKSVYYFCRHGSFACTQKLLTHEELQNISVSEKHYYLQADKSLQKSQIINFLFMKIIIYNILGQPWKIDAEKFDKDKQTLHENILIISSIFYEILMDIQDDLIVHSPQCYKLNNYQQIKGSKIYPSQSLTIKPGQYRKNQMISGLINEITIKSTYNLQKTWIREKINQLKSFKLSIKKQQIITKNLLSHFFEQNNYSSNLLSQIFHFLKIQKNLIICY